MSAQHGSWASELSALETHAKAWLAVAFGVPPAAVLVALESAGVQLPTWALALLALLPLVSATSGVVWGPANKTALDTSYVGALNSTDPYPVPVKVAGETATAEHAPEDPPVVPPVTP
jgi:hypothetical protein